ncbi:MAG: enoyl-CoA hydratase/isomerase family protein [Gammaproteobacteria bacterium]|nr:enoyl-CoA hydratase/isomerase family protein [Gammaproteobacteria bacterium]MDH3412862.1 enoyl-CoA hydratase/isomerase family protein [Gammaproteobacteria bacterium]
MDIVLKQHGRGRATLTLNRPDALNALTPQMLDALSAAIDEAAEDDAVGVIVITGAGRAFSAGVDLKSLKDRKLVNGAVGPLLDLPGRELIRRIETVPKVVLARVNGFCFTGALELALACDLIVVAAEAKLGDTHARYGIRPSWGMSQRLPRRVGVLKAHELSYTGKTFTGGEAMEMGLANFAPPLDSLNEVVDELCDQILANSRDTVAAYKDLYRATEGMRLDDGLDYESRIDYVITDTESRIESFRRR